MNRENVTIKALLLLGFGCGLAASLCAQVIMARTDDFVKIAVATGFIYIALLCTYLGWRKERQIVGAGIGILVGAAYAALAQSASPVSIGERFLEEMLNNFITYPCLLSGVLSVVLSCSKDKGRWEVPMRYLKGAFAGLVLGCAHFLFAFVLISNTYTRMLNSEIFPMFNVALALGFASAIFFPLISWAIGFRTRPGPISLWLGKLTMWRAGLLLFVLMTALGALWSVFR